MILITKTKHTKKYQMPEMPTFENRRDKVVWLKRQKMLATISNIKSVSVQVKDIKQMIYSNDPRLISLHAKFNFNNSPYKDNDYITITKSNNLNKSLIYALISTDWLLDIKTEEKKSLKELKQEYIDLQNKIYELNEKRKQMMNCESIDYKIKLFEYKLSCLAKITLSKVEVINNLGKSTIEKVLLKIKKIYEF